MTILDFITRLLLALILGIAIGFERQWRQRNAGLRTNTLVSLGSAAFTLISVSLVSSAEPNYRGDATRIISQIVTGIGFLGAGVIMRDGLNVQGLNTAATIWCSAAVGALSGVGLYVQASLVALAVILTHLIFRPLGLLISRNDYKKKENSQTEYALTIKCKSEVENHLRVLLMQQLSIDEKLLLKSLTSTDNSDPSIVIITAEILSASQQDSLIEKIASRLTIEEKVTKVSWEIVGLQTDY
jgi:putative Mg2+ transporter-C (MgtC) family protein